MRGEVGYSAPLASRLLPGMLPRKISTRCCRAFGVSRVVSDRSLASKRSEEPPAHRSDIARLQPQTLCLFPCLPSPVHCLLCVSSNFLDSADYAADTNSTDTAAVGLATRFTHAGQATRNLFSRRGDPGFRGDSMNRLLAVLALAVLISTGCCGRSCCLCNPYLWTGNRAGCGDSCGNDCCQECGCDPCGDGCCATCGPCGSGYQCAQTDPNGRFHGGICGHAADGCPLCICGKCGLFHRYCGPNCPRCQCPCEVYGGCDHCCPCPCNCCNGPGCCASGDQNYNFAPGPPTGQVAYPYYTVRGPRDFLMNNPPSIGPY
jgi:hypothetical protein